MQVCLSTSTMPSARLNDAPVGQTSTHGGSAQCWHISGRVLIRPVARSRRVTLWIHRGSVAGPCTASSPVLVVAGAHAGIAVTGAPGGVHEHSVAHGAAHRLVGLAGPAGAGEGNHGESGHEGRAGHDPRPREKPAPRRAPEDLALTAHPATSLLEFRDSKCLNQAMDSREACAHESG